MKKNEYKMWSNGPKIILPNGYHWESIPQEVVKDDLSWRGSLMDFYKMQKISRGKP